ncbi:cobalt-zinc-cadmium efflux system membrane fusion protein [Lewinella marina]|uniref:Efflux transporter periplasmic adaptor subunit n=1 Tax=Neolewinella marina TaxID=438751 RepID=A0A2G0CHJ7_9BACT|nr:efflux RND transporter periplasmic adaptor subunit [Neolewinella marina]NJB86072.1 cobalt-zinc-cadmium efflux system membrane fusion protein [Neolewinella marina]PHK99449.1 efflux transporter periplasmic adaptor subunit [Neolewinella marina]
MNKYGINCLAPAFRSLTALLLLAFLGTCAPAPDDQDDHDDHETGHHEDAHGDDHHEEGGSIHLTAAQLDAMDIRFGEVRDLKLNDYLTATGTLGLPPNGYAAVSARASGFVRDVANYVEGDYVKRGALLGYLENPEFIDLQQRYLEVRAQLGYAEQELARQEQLYADSAGVLNTVQRLQAEVATHRATVAGLRQRLEYLGLPVDGLTPESISRRIQLRAPRAGYITSIVLHDGIYVEPRTELMELIDEDHLHLELDVFERDIGKVEVGQRVTYRIPSLTPEPYTAEIHVVGKDFDATNKTVRVHAHLVGEQPPFIRDRFAEARIWLAEGTVPALPESAIVREGELHYVFAAPPQTEGENEVEFTRLRVNPGVTEDGFTAVRFVDSLPAGHRLVTDNAYFVQAQGMASELGHEH